MMLRLYTEKDVKKLVARLKEEYDGVLERSRSAYEELAEQNRVLRARLLELEGERSNTLDALLSASKEGERARREGAAAVENERKELILLAEKCRLFLDRLAKKYPDTEDAASFAAFCEELNTRLGLGGEEESGFNLEDVTSPKEPLDLKKLCLDLGLMEEDE